MLKKIIALICLIISTVISQAASAMAQKQHSQPRWVTEAVSAPGLEQRVFHSKTLGRDVSYHIFTPETYNSDESRRFPVIYWLHGIHGGPRWLPKILPLYADAMKQGMIPPSIIVFPNGLDDRMWIDSKDHATPMETILIRELIPDVDTHYRTLANRNGRMIEGFSMGGYGAAHLGLKYPELFATISLLAAGPMQPVLDVKSAPNQNGASRGNILEEIYGNDQDYFKLQSPWYLAEQNAAKIIDSKITIRMVVGDKDRMLDANREFSAHLNQLGIHHTFMIAAGAGHSVHELFATSCRELWPFYAMVLAPGFKMNPITTCPEVPEDIAKHHGGQANGTHQGGGGNMSMDEKRHRIAKRLRSFDSNGDGYVERSEVNERAQRVFDRLDKDGDGKLDKDEINDFEANGMRH